MNRYLGFRPARGQSAFSLAIPDAAASGISPMHSRRARAPAAQRSHPVRITTALIVVVAIPFVADLSPDFATGKHCRVDIGVP
jgi:hypothetical protein